MPMGDVSLWEFAEAVRDRLRDEIDYVGSIEVSEVDPTDLDEVRKGMGADRACIRVCYDPAAAITLDPALSRVLGYSFRLTVIVAARRIGSALRRLDDPSGNDITKVVKDVFAALEGRNLGILNSGGVSCGPARFLTSGDSLQAMSFPVNGRSREQRS